MYGNHISNPASSTDLYYTTQTLAEEQLQPQIFIEQPTYFPTDYPHNFYKTAQRNISEFELAK